MVIILHDIRVCTHNSPIPIVEEPGNPRSNKKMPNLWLVIECERETHGIEFETGRKTDASFMVSD